MGTSTSWFELKNYLGITVIYPNSLISCNSSWWILKFIFQWKPLYNQHMKYSVVQFPLYLFFINYLIRVFPIPSDGDEASPLEKCVNTKYCSTLLSPGMNSKMILTAFWCSHWTIVPVKLIHTRGIIWKSVEPGAADF